MKQYFYSYHIYKNSAISHYGHGDIVVNIESAFPYHEVVKMVKKKHDVSENDIHFIAFNLIN